MLLRDPLSARKESRRDREIEMLAIGDKSGDSRVAVFELPVQHGHRVVRNLCSDHTKSPPDRHSSTVCKADASKPP